MALRQSNTLPGTKFVLDGGLQGSSKPSNQGKCLYEACGATLLNQGVMFTSKERNVGKKVRMALIDMVNTNAIQAAMGKVKGAWENKAKGWNTPKQYATKYLSESLSDIQGSDFDLNLLASFLQAKGITDRRVIARTRETNNYWFRPPLSGINDAMLLGQPVLPEDVQPTDIVVVFAHSHWIPTKYLEGILTGRTYNDWAPPSSSVVDLS